MTTEAPVITQLTCQRCQHTWYPSSPALPKHCSKCNTPYWDKPRINKETGEPVRTKRRCHCFRCGHNWDSYLTHPKQCARCRSAYWDTQKG